MRRNLVAVLGVVITVWVFSPSSLAQEKYPSRAVEITVPFAAGGITDFAVRMVAEELQKIFKVPFTVTNRSGGAGSIGAAYVAQAKKDGGPRLVVVANPAHGEHAHREKVPGPFPAFWEENSVCSPFYRVDDLELFFSGSGQ